MSDPVLTWREWVTQLGVWLAALGAAAGALVGLVKWSARAIGNGAAARLTDAKIAQRLREELREDVDRLREEVGELRTRSDDCEASHRECRAENEALRKHADEREAHMSELRDRVRRLEETGCPAARCERSLE